MRVVHRLFALALGAPVLLWLACIGLVLVLAGPYGCSIHEGFATPCVVAGMDLGETAYAAGLIAAWGPLVLLPVMAGTAILWAAVTGLAALVRRARAR
jgi:hypothetical protein